MASMDKTVDKLVYILIGVVLIPVVDEIVTTAGLSGTLGTIVSLVPLIYAFNVVRNM